MKRGAQRKNVTSARVPGCCQALANVAKEVVVGALSDLLGFE